ncbi:2-C-methyl-D-erythritol 4-phosphate cytidylyltransferase [Aliiroseovarius lamellibrachiae]|uniref:2-C-methyl-D-erythritol 4-phosphate cytidylyltransferase n=1 Tax=Aliiroseovarius lamellibrachiae TaxID=1924933 RepID=UPI001BE0AC9E|nr:2-C-methyl-D-erythritol 4-phosphate cytidylyltransferase [Aliiroseovarius lamellibrachiae]MBT2132025.1 2-C-methyl-D-erythritol 4-phosphate cytidylyltransferase [Aliiroseovarius lamellibrachiae]
MEKKPCKIAVLIVAAGRGTRAGAGAPKQWRSLGNGTVAAQTVSVFQAHTQITDIAMVIHRDDRDIAKQLTGVRLIQGGATRDASVLAGLEGLTHTKPDLVLIHDVARPLVSAQVIDDVIAALSTTPGAAPAIAVTDALWRGNNGLVTGTENREGLYRAQTPQGFHFDKILAAHHAHPGGAADDVEVARHAGLDVAIVPGEERNMKITTPEDFARAERYLKG